MSKLMLPFFFVHLVASLVGGVEELGAVWAEARILVPRGTGGQGGGGAAGQGQFPEVAEQVKDNPVAPRVDIHGDPGALGEGGLPGEAGTVGGFDVPFRDFFFALGWTASPPRRGGPRDAQGGSSRTLSSIDSSIRLRLARLVESWQA